jgi:hypothetical protein
MDFIDKMNWLVKTKGWSKTRLAEAAVLSPNRVADILARRFRLVSIEYIEPLTRAFRQAMPGHEVTMDWLLDKETECPPPEIIADSERIIPSPLQKRILQAAELVGEELAFQRILSLPENSKEG